MTSPMSTSPPHRLADVPLLAGLPAPALDALARASRVRRYAAGQVLWNEGDPGEALLVLESGQLRVSRFSGAGVEIVLSVVDAPAAIGELALVDGAPRDASVIAQQPVMVRFVPRSTFHDLLRREPAVVDGLLRSLVAMVRAGNARHAITVGLDVPGRLAAWLLARATEAPASHHGLPEITLGRSQGQLAAELGTTRSTLNRALIGFESLGYLARRGDRVVIRDAQALAAQAEASDADL
ncbi:MAG: Crp/Fnr family transcriptional regulator [Thermomicrobiales bacterium]|nr:Crp/Fnr family transcriptional regulator [Thermomicrobiales bacterium]